MINYFVFEVVCVKYVISGGVIEDVFVFGFFNYGVFLEFFCYFFYFKRYKKVFCCLKYFFYSVILFD